MRLPAEWQSILQKWLGSLLGKLAVLGSLAVATALLAWLNPEQPYRIAILCFGVALLVLLWLRLRPQPSAQNHNQPSDASRTDESNLVLSDLAYTLLCATVDTRTLEAGEFQHRFGLSRDDVEEACEQLERRGLIEIEKDWGSLSYNWGNYRSTREGRKFVKRRREELGHSSSK